MTVTPNRPKLALNVRLKKAKGAGKGKKANGKKNTKANGKTTKKTTKKTNKKSGGTGGDSVTPPELKDPFNRNKNK